MHRTARDVSPRAALALAVVLVALALALRVPWLDGVPSPAGDEGNWTLFGLDLYTGRPAELAPDARFVSLAFARCIALAFHLAGGPSFAAARAVCVAGVVLGMLVSYAACASLGARRAGLVVAGALAVHPWSVLWSRTVAVPYALAFALACAGPLAFLAGARATQPRSRWLWWLAAGQLLFGAMHFSPLALIPLGACGVWLLARPGLRALRTAPALLTAVALGVPHGLVVARGALSIAAGTEGRPRHHFTQLGLRAYTYLRALADGLTGEATARHFGGDALRGLPEALLVLALLGLLLVAGRVRARDDSPGRELLRFGLLYLGVASVGLALLLAPARTWNLPAVDAERYAFAFIAPFALVLGGLATDRRPRRALASLVLAWWLLGPTARVAHQLLAGGTQDFGEYVLRGGGGHRGWRTSREHVAVVRLIEQAVAARTHGAPATILIADYALHPLHFANPQAPWQARDVSMFGMPAVQGGERCFFVRWSDGLFAPGFWPTRAADDNARFGAAMRADYERLERVRTIVQPDGSPLVEVWTGVARGPVAAVAARGFAGH